jgi:aryl-alcohol dehydrogenase-like predicted oxidoreductase
MELRPLGRTGLRIAPLVFGGNVFGWTVDEARSFELLDAFVDAGFNAIDTADVYSRWVPGHAGGESETIIGRWLAARSTRRAQVLLFTKVGSDMGGDRKGLGRRWIEQAVEDSLRRLRTDVIDLYQSHRPDAATPQAETLEAYERLIKAGKVRAIGASNYSAERLAEALKVSKAHGLPRYESLQPHYNLYERSKFEGAAEALCLDQHIGVIPYFGLAGGFLTGKYRSEQDLKGARAGMVKGMLNPRGRRVLAALDEVSGQIGGTPAQVALAWLMAKPAVTAPIASATNLDQLRDLAAATRLQLTQRAMAVLDAAGAGD